MTEWDTVYQQNALQDIPWHTDDPEPLLVNLIESGAVQGKALDLCCGAGTNSAYLQSKGFEVVGVDISPSALEMAKEKCRACTFQVGDVLRFDPGADFDLVFDRGCFHHIPNGDKPLYVRRIHAFLKQAGVFFLQCFSDKNPDFPKNLSKADIRRYFSSLFDISYIKDKVHHEPDGTPRYLYTVVMVKRWED